jgi:hypothetical protein
MPLQRNSRQRVVHPHVYDWPFTDDLGKQAKLPVMDWTADTAENVVRQLDLQLRETSHQTKRIELRTAAVSRIELSSGAPPALAVNGGLEPYAAVVLAVGFGIEEGTQVHSYWTDDQLDGIDVRGRWLVSGCGDGGLTDLMRLCIANFRHDFVTDMPGDIGKPLREAAIIEDPGERIQSFRVAAALAKQHLPKAFERRDLEVIFNAREAELYGPRSSVLNRLIVAILQEEGRFECHPSPARIDKVRIEGNRFRVRFHGGREEMFDGVVQRHGPRPALEKAFPELWELCGEQRAAWLGLRQDEDWTRFRLFDEQLFQRSTGATPLRMPANEEASVVVVARDDELRDRVFHALTRVRKDDTLAFADRKLLTNQPAILPPPDAVRSPADWIHAIQTLADADLAVFDVTDVMTEEHCRMTNALLLGIRSVARRGVTIAALRDEVDENSWARLPFNLQEVSLVRNFREGKSVERIRKTIVAGTTLAASLSEAYLDLPAFGHVRQLGATPDQYRPRPPKEQVLILSSFDKTYLSKAGWEIQQSINDAAPGIGEPAVRIIDTESPLVTSQKLYAAIRRSIMCVVDCTFWSPNVFFELGVRLACNPVNPVILIARTSCESPSPEHGALIDLLGPYQYDYESDVGKNDLRAYLVSEFERLSKGERSEQRGGISEGLTYRLVRDRIAPEREPQSEAVTRLLLGSAQVLIGSDMLRFGTLPGLFADREALSSQAREQAVERLLAAWYYLKARLGLPTQHSRAAQISEFLEVGEALSVALAGSKRKENLLLRRKVHLDLEKIYDLETTGGPLKDAERAVARARRLRRTNVAKAEEILNMATGILADDFRKRGHALERNEPAGYDEQRMVAVLAECYGLLGTLRRDQNRLAQAIQDYKHGAELEKDHRYALQSSYNEVLWIVSRVLEVPERAPASSDDVHVALEQARLRLSGLLAVERRGDVWALADLAMIETLAGAEKHLEAWDKFAAWARKSGTEFAITSSCKVLASLVAATDGKPSLQARFEKAQARLASPGSAAV